MMLHCPSSPMPHPSGQSSKQTERIPFLVLFLLSYIQTVRQKAFLPVFSFLSPSLISVFMVNPYHISLGVSHELAPYKFYGIQNRGKLAVCDGGNIYSHQEGFGCSL